MEVMEEEISNFLITLGFPRELVQVVVLLIDNIIQAIAAVILDIMS